jgi:dCMP deaminase
MSLRPSWEEYFLELAKTAALRADCTRSKVGAVLVDRDNRILSVGYNGAPAGAPGCLTKNACPRGMLSYEELPPLSGNYNQNCIAIHAERNAILYADPEKRIGSTLYVTRSPCRDCQLLALASGVTRFVWFTPEGAMAYMKIYH